MRMTRFACVAVLLGAMPAFAQINATITAPSNGATLTGSSVNVGVSITSSFGIQNFTIEIDGFVDTYQPRGIGNTLLNSYSATIPTSLIGVTNGAQTITLRANEGGFLSSDTDVINVTVGSATPSPSPTPTATPSPTPLPGSVAALSATTENAVYDPVRNRVYVVNDTTDRIDIVDVASLTITGSLNPNTVNPRGVDISQDGSKLVVAGGSEEEVTIINLNTGVAQPSVSTSARTFADPYRVAFFSNGKVAVAYDFPGGGNSTFEPVDIYDPVAGTITATQISGPLNELHEPTVLARTHDYSTIIAADGGTSGSYLKTMNGSGTVLASFNYPFSGTFWLGGGNDGTLFTWNGTFLDETLSSPTSLSGGANFPIVLPNGLVAGISSQTTVSSYSPFDGSKAGDTTLPITLSFGTRYLIPGDATKFFVIDSTNRLLAVVPVAQITGASESWSNYE